LFGSAFIFSIMSNSKDPGKKATTGEPAPKLTTEGLLSEKDEQGQAIEHAKKLAKEVLEKWARLKGKVIHKFKK